MSPGERPGDFGFGEDEALLRDTARAFLDEHLPVEVLRRLVADDPERVYERGEAPPWDPSLWKRIVELGWTGLAVPEARGGAGFRMVGIVGLLEEIGRHALPSPLPATLDVCHVLAASGGSTGAERWLAAIADGATASLAITPERGDWEPARCDVTAVADPHGGLRLDGRAAFVQDARKCDAFLVHARSAEGSRLCRVERDAAGLSLEADHIHDLTRDQATLQLDGVRVEPGAVVSREGERALAAAWPALLLTTAADLCGVAEWQLATTVEYARNRVQFDRPIGFFQAVKHPLVDAMVEIDRARSLLYHAAAEIDRSSPEALRAARMAKSAASDAGSRISDASVQLHGGIGFTWECDVHIFFKRSLHGQVFRGDGVHQRRALAEDLIGPIGSGAGGPS